MKGKQSRNLCHKSSPSHVGGDACLGNQRTQSSSHNSPPGIWWGQKSSVTVGRHLLQPKIGCSTTAAGTSRTSDKTGINKERIV